MIQVTYRKNNGEVFQRIRSTYPEYKVGSRTSMGWTVLDIKYGYKNKYYSITEYDKLVDRDYKRHKKIFKIKQEAKRIYNNLAYSIIILILLKILESVTIKLS